MFKNKTVLVTGGSSGIGRATAILFAKQEADVAITFKNNKKEADDVVAEITKMGRKSLSIRANLNKDRDAKRVVKETIRVFKKIDVLVNNAGGYVDGDEWNLESKVWIESLKQNLVSAMSMSKYTTSFFQKQGGGVIINVASKHGVFGHADSISYSAAKAGIINITQAYSKLLSSFGGRANSVSPSAVNAGYWLIAPKEELEEKLKRKPNRKLLEPEEIAERIVFLASDEAKNINGQNILIG